MSDHWLQEAERIGDENSLFSDWIESNKEDILEQYTQTLDIDDVPDDFIQNLFDKHQETGNEE